MRLLLDTHILEWLVRDPAELKVAERAAVSDPGHHLIVSPISIWEIRIKWEARDRHGERKGLLDPAVALSFLRIADMELAPLTVEDCAAALSVPLAHRDPFDRMILLHAHRLHAKLLTRDRVLRGHPLAVQLL